MDGDLACWLYFWGFSGVQRSDIKQTSVINNIWGGFEIIHLRGRMSKDPAGCVQTEQSCMKWRQQQRLGRVREMQRTHKHTTDGVQQVQFCRVQQHEVFSRCSESNGLRCRWRIGPCRFLAPTSWKHAARQVWLKMIVLLEKTGLCWSASRANLWLTLAGCFSGTSLNRGGAARGHQRETQKTISPPDMTQFH